MMNSQKIKQEDIKKLKNTVQKIHKYGERSPRKVTKNSVPRKTNVIIRRESEKQTKKRKKADIKKVTTKKNINQKAVKNGHKIRQIVS